MKLLAENQTGAPQSQADPFALLENGRYYIYATGRSGVHLYESDTLGDFTYSGICYSRDGWDDYWAPAVIKLGEKFYLYYSAKPKDQDDAHAQALAVAEADSPAGPFAYIGQIAAPFSIDAHPALYHGDPYLFYSVNDTACERVGTLIVLDKLIAPDKLEGKPVVAVRPTLDEEIFKRDRFRPGQHWHTLEGACYLYRDGVHYLMYSGSAYTNPTYFVGYAAAKGEPADMRELKFEKMPDAHTYAPLLCQNDFVEGTGHNSTVSFAGREWIVYHGRDRCPGADRVMRADVLQIEDGKLSVKITP